MDGGLGARVGLGVLRAGAVLTRPLGYRGMGRLSRVLGVVPGLRGGSAVVCLDAGQRLRVPMGDYYWSRLLFRDFFMEPEVGRILHRVLEPDSVFLDCGANIGLWSLVASGRIDDPDRILAMEASPPTFARLQETSELNGDVFRTLHVAVCGTDGAPRGVVVDGRHARSRVVGPQHEGGRVVQVPGRTLDALISDRGLPLPEDAPIVLKLDVEGLEAEVMGGARALLRRPNVLLIYEDHADDTTCEASRFVLEALGYAVAPAESPGRSLADVGAVQAWKRGRRGGLNWVAGHPGAEVLTRACR